MSARTFASAAALRAARMSSLVMLRAPRKTSSLTPNQTPAHPPRMREDERLFGRGMDDASALSRVKMRDPKFAPRSLSVERRGDGAWLLTNTAPVAMDF